MKQQISIHWFKQDLRLQDNPSINYLSEKEEKTLFIYIFENDNDSLSLGSASKVWLHHSLEYLNKQLNGKLLIFSDSPKNVFKKLIEDFSVSSVSWNRCYDPASIKNDAKIKIFLKKHIDDVKSFNGSLLWEPWEILKSDGTPFKVFTPFYKNGCLAFAPPRKPISKKIYTILSFGWSGKAKHWQRHEVMSLVLAGLCTPLVLSVHTIVSMDFATSVIPGWHTTIFPPYFVAGAIFSGFAMVQTLLLVMRKVVNMESYITMQHIEMMNIIIMVTGSIVGVAYITELFMAWYSGVEYEQYAFLNRATGPYWWSYWAMMTCNVISPQLMWIKKLRRNIVFTFILSIFVNIGMWFERFVIIVTSLHRDYLPSSWSMFSPTFVDIGIYIGTIGFFMVLFLLYSRTFPVIAQAELKTILKSSSDTYRHKK